MKRRVVFLISLVVLTGMVSPEPQQVAHSVDDLPLVELPVKQRGTVLAIFLSGDGGWAPLVKGVSAELVRHGIPVVGLNERSYLWQRKTPEETAADLALIIGTYRRRWGRDSVVIMGYSRGAGIAPFSVNRLPPTQRNVVKSLVLIGAEHGAGFQFTFRELMGGTSSTPDVPVMPEMRRLGSTPVLCLYGEDEKDTICPELGAPAVGVKLAGGHHYDGAFGEIGRRIAEWIDGRR